mmetsp:Transcript_11519/g.26717  ORF Transcript_11519/g.26717 Transcript_11519/m.26717 type:complete len:1003 (-) Transcript_11519:179-3187(-)|eukprot:CAMPEP_0178443696 /NCGR_PEP_ID=MMETSP0689_2-20121128/39052_1 /TAXON_ID=160604 /ORGANISM="Amphidinium massartii, Strain CS-259" /LENGTH=1002 /DNA_ID=CAMNT_0020067759 /DNA_START=17 /DNA_END=3025 /DNA_ORIENTATION=+
MAPKAKANVNGKASAPPPQPQQPKPPKDDKPQTPAQPKQPSQAQPKQAAASKPTEANAKAAPKAEGQPKAQAKQQPQAKQQAQPKASSSGSKAEQPQPKAAQAKQAPAGKAEAAPKAASKAASKAQPKQQAQQAQPQQHAQPKGQAAPKAKSQPAPAAPVEQTMTDDGFGEVARRRKRRNNKKAAETFNEDPTEAGPAEDHQEENYSEEVMAMMAVEKSQWEAKFKATTDSLRKDIDSIAEVGEAGSQTDVAQQKAAIGKASEEIEKALKAGKVSRPKRLNTGMIIQSMEELFQKCNKSEASNIPEELRKDMLEDLEGELKTVMAWEAYKDFQGQLNELKAVLEKKLKVNDDLASKVRTGNNQRRMMVRVAAVKGVEGLDAEQITTLPLDIDAQVAVLPWLYKRYEKQYGVVIDRAQQGKGLLARGLKSDVEAAAAALKAVDVSANKSLNVTDRQAAQVMGAQQSNARKIEETFKGVYLHSEQNKITIYGSKTQVPLCVKHLEGIISETAAPPQHQQMGVKELTIDKDRARALIGLNGRKVKDLEAETGTSIKVSKPSSEENDNTTVRISGEKAKVEGARQKIESFLRSLEGVLVPVPMEIILRLYDNGTQRPGKGAGKGGKGAKNGARQEIVASPEAASKFSALRETPGLTVSRKADGIHLLGTKDVVAKSKETLEECLKEATNTPMILTLSFAQGRLWTQERCDTISASSGAEVKILRRQAEVSLEVSGTQEQKAAAETAVNEVNEAHNEVLTHPVSIDTRSLTSRHGERIQEIERSCDVSITMDRKAQAVKIHGSKETTESAKDMIEKLLAEAPKDHMITMEIDPAVAAAVIGKGGVTVRDIKSRAGCTDLQVNGNQVVITGTTEEAVEKARTLVQEVLQKKATQSEERERGKGKGEGRGDGERPPRGEREPRGDREARDNGREHRERDPPNGEKSHAANGSSEAAASSSNHGPSKQWKSEAKVQKSFECQDQDFPTLGGGESNGSKVAQRPMGAWAST